MAKFDEDAFIRLVRKNEKKILNAKSPKDLREGIEFIRKRQLRPTSHSGIIFDNAKKRCGKALEVPGISYDFVFPEDHVLKNQACKNILQKFQAVRDIPKYENLAKELGLPDEATQEEVDARIAEIKEAKLRERAEAKRIQAQEKKRASELEVKRLQAERELAAKRMQTQRALEAHRIELEAKRTEEKRNRLGLNGEADPELAERLFKSVEQGLQRESINPAGYLYFKVWVLPDGSKWYKIGITNDLRRRDAEQNVLPVPATTIHSARFFSIEHARIVEKKFLETLSIYRIKGANNKELLSLKPEQVQAIAGAMKAIKS